MLRSFEGPRTVSFKISKFPNSKKEENLPWRATGPFAPTLPSRRAPSPVSDWGEGGVGVRKARAVTPPLQPPGGWHCLRALLRASRRACLSRQMVSRQTKHCPLLRFPANRPPFQEPNGLSRQTKRRLTANETQQILGGGLHQLSEMDQTPRRQYRPGGTKMSPGKPPRHSKNISLE